LTIYFAGEYMTVRMMALFTWILQNLSSLDLSLGGASQLLQSIFLQVLIIIGPLMLALVLASIAGTVIQTGFLISGKPLQFQPNRINPIEGAKRIFSWRMLMETFKSIFKFSVVALVSYQILEPLIPGAAAMMDGMPVQIIPIIFDVAIRLALYILIFMLIMALSDYAFQRWEFEKSIRMSRYEVKQELKETEGDPQIRARVRSIRQQQLRQQMMTQVREAEVVITNPTHFAIAIKYEPEKREAPHVVAKGRGRIAQRIKEIALENDIPLHEEPWLARELYRTCEVEDTIPVDLWQAVARVLAFVRSLDGKRALLAAQVGA
jgi:flagellar biosynthetic protein FlhB